MPCAPYLSEGSQSLWLSFSLRTLSLSADACVIWSAHLAASNLACAAHQATSPSTVAGLSFNGKSADLHCLQVQRAVALWQQLLDGRFRLLRRWCCFVSQSGPHMISEDTWRQVCALTCTAAMPQSGLPGMFAALYSRSLCRQQPLAYNSSCAVVPHMLPLHDSSS